MEGVKIWTLVLCATASTIIRREQAVGHYTPKAESVIPGQGVLVTKGGHEPLLPCTLRHILFPKLGLVWTHL